MRTIIIVATAHGDAAAVPRPRLRGAAAAARRTAHHAAGHAKAIGRRLSGSALTAAGLGCIDVGAFQGSTIAGWIVTGLSVLLLDWTLE